MLQEREWKIIKLELFFTYMNTDSTQLYNAKTAQT